jgi:hypothetical protein
MTGTPWTSPCWCGHARATCAGVALWRRRSAGQESSARQWFGVVAGVLGDGTAGVVWTAGIVKSTPLVRKPRPNGEHGTTAPPSSAAGTVCPPLSLRNERTGHLRDGHPLRSPDSANGSHDHADDDGTAKPERTRGKALPTQWSHGQSTQGQLRKKLDARQVRLRSSELTPLQRCRRRTGHPLPAQLLPVGPSIGIDSRVS